MSPARYVTPRDAHGEPLVNARPQATALARTVSAMTSQVMIALDDETRLITVYAISKDAYVHWAGGSNPGEDYANSTNFDEVVVAGTQADIAVPYQADGSIFPNVSIVGRESGGTVVVVEK